MTSYWNSAQASVLALLGVLAQTPVVIGDGFLIFRRDGGGLPSAGSARSALAAKHKFQLVHRAKQFALHALHHRGVARETARIELLHSPRQVGHFFRGLRIVLDHVAQLVQVSHPLLKSTLRIVPIARFHGRRSLPRTSVPVIASVEVIPYGAVYTAVANIAA